MERQEANVAARLLVLDQVIKRKLCQGHFLHIMKLELRRTMSMIYKDPASCYATFDFSGKGYITAEDVLRHPVIK